MTFYLEVTLTEQLGAGSREGGVGGVRVGFGLEGFRTSPWNLPHHPPSEGWQRHPQAPPPPPTTRPRQQEVPAELLTPRSKPAAPPSTSGAPPTCASWTLLPVAAMKVEQRGPGAIQHANTPSRYLADGM